MKKINIKKAASYGGVFAMAVMSLFALTAILNSFFNKFYFTYQTPVIFQFPLIINERVIEKPPTPTPTPTATPTPTPTLQSWKGTASYYSRAGCIGCGPDLIMANGQPLDDEAMTVAFNKAPLGSKLKIRNLDNNMIATATVTDTGGFEKLGRIIDLTPKVKRTLSCGDLCYVKVSLLEN